MLYTLSCLGILNPSSLPRVNNSECFFVFKLSETIDGTHSTGGQEYTTGLITDTPPESPKEGENAV